MSKKISVEDLFCDAETLETMAVVTSLSQRGQEMRAFERLARIGEVDARGLEKLKEGIARDVAGTAQLIWLYCEAYRRLVEKGKIMPVNAEMIMDSIGINAETADKMLTQGRKSIKEIGLGKLLDFNNTGLYACEMDDCVDEAEKIGRKIVRAGIKRYKELKEDDRVN